MYNTLIYKKHDSKNTELITINNIIMNMFETKSFFNIRVETKLKLIFTKF